MKIAIESIRKVIVKITFIGEKYLLKQTFFMINIS